MLDLFLLRHAPALSRKGKKFPNDDRPLSEDGRMLMKEAAQGIARMVTEFDRVYSSPLVRAFDTASIVTQAMKSKEKIVISQALLPDEHTHAAIELIASLDKKSSVLLVGHEPHIGALAAQLLGTKANSFEFKKGALAKLRIGSCSSKNCQAQLRWFLTPKQLALLGEA